MEWYWEGNSEVYVYQPNKVNEVKSNIGIIYTIELGTAKNIYIFSLIHIGHCMSILMTIFDLSYPVKNLRLSAMAFEIVTNKSIYTKNRNQRRKWMFVL